MKDNKEKDTFLAPIHTVQQAVWLIPSLASDNEGDYIENMEIKKKPSFSAFLKDKNFSMETCIEYFSKENLIETNVQVEPGTKESNN